jgi:hypothetical protein
MAVVLGVAAVQFFYLAVLSEYIIRIHTETKDRPLFVIRERYGFPDDDEAT